MTGGPGRPGGPQSAKVAASLGSPRRIGVFRALMLGDMLCATPALRAVARAWPQAEITLIGLPWARELARRLPAVHRFLPFPGMPGLPETEPDPQALQHFIAQMKAEPFDLMLQLHGNGRVVNPLIADCAPRRSAGFHAAGGWRPDAALYLPWPEQGTEVDRLLALVDHLGLPRVGTQLDFPLAPADHRALAAVWPAVAEGRPYVCVHAGARFSSRRWPADRFAAVADALAARGFTVVLTGSAGEAPLVAEVQRAMKAAAVNLTGRTDLWSLGALVAGARLLLSNDTGLSHVGAALRTPSVIVSSGSDVARWAPLDTRLHAVLWQPMHCRPCAFEDCPYDHGCAKAVTVAQVLRSVEQRLSMDAFA